MTPGMADCDFDSHLQKLLRIRVVRCGAPKQIKPGGSQYLDQLTCSHSTDTNNTGKPTHCYATWPRIYVLAQMLLAEGFDPNVTRVKARHTNVDAELGDLKQMLWDRISDTSMLICFP